MLVTDVHDNPPNQDLAEGVWPSSGEEEQLLEGQGQAARSTGKVVSWDTHAYVGRSYLDQWDPETVAELAADAAAKADRHVGKRKLRSVEVVAQASGASNLGQRFPNERGQRVKEKARELGKPKGIAKRMEVPVQKKRRSQRRGESEEAIEADES